MGGAGRSGPARCEAAAPYGLTAELADLPREWLHYVQLCDAPAARPTTTEGLIHAARAERLFPGEGGIDLLGIMRPLPRDVPVSLEIPSETLARTVGPEERARRALVAAKGLLARLEAEDAATVG